MRVRRINPTLLTEDDSPLLRELFASNKGKCAVFERDKRHIYLKRLGNTSIMQPFGIILSHDIICRPSNRNPAEDRYEVIDHNHLIGSGGFSHIYAVACTLAPLYNDALITKNNKQRVVKIQEFDPDDLKYLLDEAQLTRLAGNLHAKSPVLTKLLNQRYKSYIVMKRLNGYDLQTILDKMFCNELTLSTYKRLTITALLLERLSELHQRGVIHRDLKPENVMMDISTNELQLFDFGLSKRIDTDDKDEFQGTPGFIPVEVYHQEGTDEKSDVFSMAIIIGQLWYADEPGLNLEDMEDYNFPNIFKDGTHDLNSLEISAMMLALLKMIRLAREHRSSVNEALAVFTSVREDYVNRKIDEYAQEYKIKPLHHIGMFNRRSQGSTTTRHDPVQQLKMP
ncbi:Serine/threonine-protein kinase PknB [Aquicella siphonis]|uniref:Serine/threonine-protein kinase PknB n=1 Tax=Aquicella siphonis TaxID=254247 RepID=A0A5E4PET4_9COXI|nr:protein kinase [Aquicella siphonis]VVC75499.1 Serine/threonine-protein kinase PknB [Aquicella siphonis]